MGEERLIPVPPRGRRAVTKVIDERVVTWYCDKELLEELPPTLALELWQDLRHVRDWVESSPEKRAVVFNPEPPLHVLAKRREARASAPELAVPLDAFTEMRSAPQKIDASELGAACEAAAEWAVANDYRETAIEWAEIAALVEPENPKYQKVVTSFIRRVPGRLLHPPLKHAARHMARSSLWTLVLGLALTACTDTPSLVTPPDRAGFAVVGAEVDGDEVILNLEGLPHGTFVGTRFRSLGLEYFPVYTAIVDEFSAWYPPTSGSSFVSVLPTNSFHWYGENGKMNWYREFPVWFREPVAEFGMSVKAAHGFSLTCSDRQGQILGSDTTAGVWGQWRERNYEGHPTLPAPPEYLKVRASGIFRCIVRMRGGSLDDIRFRRSPSSSLKLECSGDRGTNSVTRGTGIVCRASKDPEAPGEVRVTGWSFDGINRDDDDPTSLEWRGIMVKGGTVRLTGKVGSGSEQTTSANVVVADREWSERQPEYTFDRIGNGTDPRLVLPDEILWTDDLGSANWFPTQTPASAVPDYTDEVPSGPNEGIKYFVNETTIQVFGYYALNSAAMSRGSGFYAAQARDNAGGGTRVGGMNWCPASVVTGSLPGLVDAHEQMHGEVYERALVGEVGAALTRLERITSDDYDVLYRAYDDEWERVDITARAASNDLHRQPRGLISPTAGGRPCALRNERGRILEAKPHS